MPKLTRILNQAIELIDNGDGDGAVARLAQAKQEIQRTESDLIALLDYAQHDEERDFDRQEADGEDVGGHIVWPIRRLRKNWDD